MKKSISKLDVQDAAKLYSKKISFTLIGIFILFFGAGLAIKANVGIGTFDAFAVTLADVTGLTTGKIAIICNFALIVTQILSLRKNFKPNEFIQIPYIFVVGLMLDLFVEVLLVGWMENSPYIIRLIVSAASNVIRSIGVMIIFESELMKAPLEAVAEIIGNRVGKPLGRIVQLFDVFFIVSSLAMTFFFKTGAYRIREGTAIALLLFGPLMDVFRKPIRKFMIWAKVQKPPVPEVPKEDILTEKKEP